MIGLRRWTHRFLSLCSFAAILATARAASDPPCLRDELSPTELKELKEEVHRYLEKKGGLAPKFQPPAANKIESWCLDQYEAAAKAKNPRLAVLCIWLRAAASAQCADKDTSNKIDVAKAVAILQKSKDQLYLQKTALSLIRSGQPGAMEKAATFLCDPDFLERLDGDLRNHAPDRWDFRLLCLLHAAAELGTAQAEEAILKLGKDPAYDRPPIENWRRRGALILAAGFLKKPSQKLLTFIEDQSTVHEKLHQRIVIGSLLRFRTPEAARAVESRLLSADYSDSMKKYCVKTWFPLFRYEPSTLELYERLLKADLKDKSLRDTLVATLFGDEDQLWWRIAGVHPDDRIQPLKDASTEILKRLVPLSDTSLKLDIDGDTKETVRRAKKEIDELLAEREKKK